MKKAGVVFAGFAQEQGDFRGTVRQVREMRAGVRIGNVHKSKQILEATY